MSKEIDMDNNLIEISKQIRKRILEITTEAGSGHPTSSLSAVDLMVALMYGGLFKYKIDDPGYHNNDRLIFSKGHASPLLYSLWSIAGVLSIKELMSLRKFDSNLEGHPTMRFPYTEVATGSLGQGLSVGVGMALSAKMDKLPYKTYVLLGDSEMAEGQNWEAMQVAAHYKLDNLVGILDVNRLGQRGETMDGHNISSYTNKIRAFGWHVEEVGGHDIEEILLAYQQAAYIKNKPTMIVGKTLKGKGVSLLENKEDWHGKVLDEDQLEDAIVELGEMSESIVGNLQKPKEIEVMVVPSKSMDEIDTKKDYKNPLATRKAYGHALVEAFPKYPQMVVLDAEMSNSTFAETFKNKYPHRFFEMFIAEQNMVSVAVGMALRGKIPFLSSFAAFLTRAHDQFRMAQFSGVNINVMGSHAGVSMGPDGFSQMGLDDISMFRAILGSVVLCPADHVSAEKMIDLMTQSKGISYMRATKMEADPIYGKDDEFELGGSKILKSSEKDVATLVSSGVTLHESLKAYHLLKDKNISVKVIDLYSIKPLDVDALVKACKETEALVVVEDHFSEGGVAEAVRSGLVYETTPIHSLAVKKIPRSGDPNELLEYENINSQAIVEKIYELLKIDD